ncbi:MAG: hypothetical protein K0S19_250 [Geminicoccaceae bacterium]|nr:hypothetical protein [Geminicoccaceae bacterium]
MLSNDGLASDYDRTRWGYPDLLEWIVVVSAWGLRRAEGSAGFLCQRNA